MIEVKDIAEYEENDSELAKYTISKLSSEKKDLQQRIDEAIEYCEEIRCRAIDIDDGDFDLGQDSVARDLLNILKGSEE